MNPNHLPTRYVEARVGGKGVRLRVVKDDGRQLSGFAVNSAGEDIERETKKTTTRFLYVIGSGEVTRELRLNKFYGVLEQQED